MHNKKILWILRIAVAGEFIGHGALALGGNAEWAGWIQKFITVDTTTALSLLWWIGLVDIILALIVLWRPVRPLLFWMAVWGLWTALLRPLVGGKEIWDFIERFANWGAPLALYYLLPKK